MPMESSPVHLRAQPMKSMTNAPVYKRLFFSTGCQRTCDFDVLEENNTLSLKINLSVSGPIKATRVTIIVDEKMSPFLPHVAPQIQLIFDTFQLTEDTTKLSN